MRRRGATGGERLEGRYNPRRNWIMTEDVVLFDVTDGIATISLNRPEKRNAYVPAIGAGILDALDTIEERDEGVRCIVVEGRGPAFSAGGDISGMKDRIEEGTVAIEDAERLMNGTNEVVRRVFRCPIPTVAKLDGSAVGAGASIALACDVILASDDGAMAFAFKRVGLALDTGTSYLLPRLVGINVAKELVYSGEVVSAERGVDIGLFNRCIPSDRYDEEVDEFVTAVSDGPTHALRQAKRLLEAGQHRTFEQCLDEEALVYGALRDTSDHEEGVEAFIEGRSPDFGDE